MDVAFEIFDVVYKEYIKFPDERYTNARYNNNIIYKAWYSDTSTIQIVLSLRIAHRRISRRRRLAKLHGNAVDGQYEVLASTCTQ
jgi:hypothetical protein